MDKYLGVDVGGTNSAVVVGTRNGDIVDRIGFPTRTDLGPDYALDLISRNVADLALKNKDYLRAAGISCGGPLDPDMGVVQSPPNLPGWDDVGITRIVADALDSSGVRKIPVTLRNDADAGALAERRFGAGVGSASMAFLTFGTGIGAGLILDGRLFKGTSGIAGEIGHVRVAADGPPNYGKAGSFEGFCSGSGIEGLATRVASERAAEGKPVAWYKSNTPNEIDAGKISVAELAGFARRGDPEAQEVFSLSGRYLGRGCALLIDLLNLDMIVIGSVFVRCRDLLEGPMQSEIEAEALPAARSRCRVVPAALGESIGDVASLCAAMDGE